MCEVTVSSGVLRGNQCTAFDGTKYYSFEGIPYAKPPIGELRFRDPQPPDNWTGAKDCTKPGNKCAQINPFSGKGFEGSEDCLYLNIYTPYLPSENINRLPVLFFVHGGRLLIGYGDYYQPDYFLKHDVILVTFNYRLGILGFLSLDTPEVPGNAGMKDCVMALKWINKNISSFNGEPNNITIFGESAGAAICTAFLTSKMADGLFSKVIAQSGNNIADVFMTVQDHVTVACGIAKYLDKDIKDAETLLDFLKNLPVEDLITAYIMAESETPQYVLNPVLMPVVEREFKGVERFMHEPPIVSYKLNRFIKVPIMAGLNSLEGATFVQKDQNRKIIYEKNLKYFVPHYLYLDDKSEKFSKIINGIRKFYFKDQPIDDNNKIGYIKLLSDAYFHRDVTNFAELVSKHNKDFYAYTFQYIGNMNIGVMKSLDVKGTTHGDMIQYQFYTKNKAQRCNERDLKIVDFLSETWTNFAKYGKPMWKNQNVDWLPYTPQDKHTLVINEEKALLRNPDCDSFKFWTDLCGDRAKL